MSTARTSKVHRNQMKNLVTTRCANKAANSMRMQNRWWESQHWRSHEEPTHLTIKNYNMQCSSEPDDFWLGNEKSASHHDIRVKCNLSFYCEQKRSRWPSQRLFCVQAWSSLFSKESPALEDARLRVHLLITNLTRSHKPTNTRTRIIQTSTHMQSGWIWHSFNRLSVVIIWIRTLGRIWTSLFDDCWKWIATCDSRLSRDSKPKSTTVFVRDACVLNNRKTTASDSNRRQMHKPAVECTNHFQRDIIFIGKCISRAIST